MNVEDIEPKGLDETIEVCCRVCSNSNPDELIQIHKDSGNGFVCIDCSDELDYQFESQEDFEGQGNQ